MNIHYKAISDFYGDECAKRSGVRLMNHIDEGLKVMASRNASMSAMEAFCIHPLLQTDADLARTIDLSIFQKFYQVSVALAMEYRAVANAYLLHHCVSEGDEIKLSKLEAVNEMLVADKVQNRKDFILYHRGTHPNSDKLDLYFNNWQRRLGVDVHQYEQLCVLMK